MISRLLFDDIPGPRPPAARVRGNTVFLAGALGQGQRARAHVLGRRGGRGWLTAEDEAELNVQLPESGVERCLSEDPGKGTVNSIISALKYTPWLFFGPTFFGFALLVVLLACSPVTH